MAWNIIKFVTALTSEGRQALLESNAGKGASKGSNMLQESDGDRKCSFCQKNCSEAAYLFAGVDGSICSECVLVCLEILKDEKIVPKGVAPDYKMSSIPAASA